MSVYESTKPDRAAHDAAPTKPYKLLRLPAVMERCALGRSSIYAGVKAGTFVAPVRLSARAVGWREDEIDRWVSERVKTGNR